MWRVHWILSSPHYPKSNSHTEAAVKAMKSLVAKSAEHGNISSDAFLKVLLEWRNTPRAQGLSPAEILYGCQTRSLLPLHQHAYEETSWGKCGGLGEEMRKAQDTSKGHHDKMAGRELRSMQLGQQVLIWSQKSRRWDLEATIMEVGRNRDYNVKTSSGHVLWRNRRYLRPLRPVKGPVKNVWFILSIMFVCPKHKGGNWCQCNVTWEYSKMVTLYPGLENGNAGWGEVNKQIFTRALNSVVLLPFFKTHNTREWRVSPRVVMSSKILPRGTGFCPDGCLGFDVTLSIFQNLLSPVTLFAQCKV